MKKIILLTFWIIATVQISFAQNAIAKLKFEEAYALENYELTVMELTDVETLIKTTNPKILYLKISALSKIIAINPLKDYFVIENTRKFINNYLRDYETLPNNEDKYRDIYKLSETFKSYPQTEEEFLLQKVAFEEKKRQELAQLKAIETSKVSDDAKIKNSISGFMLIKSVKATPKKGGLINQTTALVFL